MNFTPVKTPTVFKRIFPNMVWQMPTKGNAIYLTFDDGPTPEITEWTLECLEKYKAKATFFCIGKNVQEYPDIYQGILDTGHAVGNHTQNHVKGWQLNDKAYLNNVSEASQFIDSNMFRPPYGQIKPSQARKLKALGYKVIMWNILSLDWKKTVSPNKCVFNIINNTQSGDIVVFHDSVKAHKNMQYALPKALKYFSEKGYEFKRIPERVQ